MYLSMGANDPRSDAELLRDSARDADAFGVFYDRHARALSTFFLRRTADSALAADLTAETFAQAFGHRRRYRNTGDPAAAWLYTIAVRQLNEYFRQQCVSKKYRARLGVPERAPSDDFASVDDLDELRSRLPALQHAFSTLSVGSAEAVMLRVGHGWSYHRIADQLGCTPPAARVRVSRALTQLERHLNPTDPRSNR
jgi:RNA polymerase sigma-70 factor (ECF subfamily)